MAFLDASKAFDRVNYATLFCKLSARDVPGVILICWYAGQSCSILLLLLLLLLRGLNTRYVIHSK